MDGGGRGFYLNRRHVFAFTDRVPGETRQAGRIALRLAANDLGFNMNLRWIRPAASLAEADLHDRMDLAGRFDFESVEAGGVIYLRADARPTRTLYVAGHEAAHAGQYQREGGLLFTPWLDDYEAEADDYGRRIQQQALRLIRHAQATGARIVT